MKRYIKKIAWLARASKNSIRDEGIARFVIRAKNKIYYKYRPESKPRIMKDVLFIVGPNLPQVERYRIDHQIEQLNSSAMTAERKNDTELTLSDVKYYRAFIFCRFPHTDMAEEFVSVAKSFNKTVVYEIDDLVFDTKFTDTIDVVKNMNKRDRELYDSGVNRCQRMLRLCDYAITTTPQIANIISTYSNVKDTYVNRNVASDKMVALSNEALRASAREKHTTTVTLGYFSGSITHNEDFEMVLPALIDILESNPCVRLHLGGMLDKRTELARFKDRVTTAEFIDWRDLPEQIAKCDINLAPYAKKSVFNEAKSEIKWLESSLVGVPTVASDYGAFHSEIENGITGILVADTDDWKETLSEFIDDGARRETIATNARDEALRRTTLRTGKGLADWLKSKFAGNVMFVVPSSEISGGVNVVLKHADILRKHGKDVTILNAIQKKQYTSNSRKLEDHNEILLYNTDIQQRIDEMVATLWSTVPYVRGSEAVVKNYFVQNFETDFLKPGQAERLRANATYSHDDLKYTTMSRWCQDWLRNQFGQKARYASNGLWLERYTFKKRNFDGRKIRILIEGDPKSKWKNVDEAFEITNKLDPKKYQVNFLSYHAEPKAWYRVDNFYQKIESEEVGSVYGSNDILLKTSLLESFSYPPLEMMATGGYVVVIPNGGNIEYLKDQENCLMFESGDMNKAIQLINQISTDKVVRDKLSGNGKKLSDSYDWKNVEDQVLELYGDR